MMQPPAKTPPALRTECRVGPTVDAIAAACGLEPEVVGLTMVAILGGIEPRHGLGSSAVLCGSSPALNLLFTGAEDCPGLRWLLSMLLAPLAERQGQLRDSAAACRKPRLDQLKYGSPGAEGFDDPTRDLLKRFNGSPFGGNGFGESPVKDRGLEALCHPTLYLSNPAPATIFPALDEALDGQLLVLDGEGTTLSSLLAPVRGKGAGATSALASLLAPHGSDGTMGNLDPRRGPGTLQHRHLNMVSLLPRRTLVGLLGGGEGLARPPLGHFLLIDASAAVAKGQVRPSLGLGEAMEVWERYLQNAVSSRLAGQTCATPGESLLEHLRSATASHHAALASAGLGSGLSLGGLWALPFQIGLGLGTLLGNRGVLDASFLAGLSRLSQWAVARHVSASVRLRDEAAGRGLERRRLALLGALGRRGPCSFRELLRCFSIQRKELYGPLIDRLVAEGEVVLLEGGRFALPGKAPRNAKAPASVS